MAEIERKARQRRAPGARCLEDPRAPERIQHTFAEMISVRALLIAAGCADFSDSDALRADPAFEMAVAAAPKLHDLEGATFRSIVLQGNGGPESQANLIIPVSRAHNFSSGSRNTSSISLLNVVVVVTPDVLLIARPAVWVGMLINQKLNI